MRKFTKQNLIEKMVHNEILDKINPNLSSAEKKDLYFSLKKEVEGKFKNLKGMNARKRNFRSLYSKYLRSKEWLELRERVLKRDKYTCQGCGDRANHCHHLSYGSFVFRGYSEREECVSLCLLCHEYVHQKKFFK